MSEKGGFTLTKILQTDWAIARRGNWLQKHIGIKFSWDVCVSMNSLKLLNSTFQNDRM